MVPVVRSFLRHGFDILRDDCFFGLRVLTAVLGLENFIYESNAERRALLIDFLEIGLDPNRAFLVDINNEALSLYAALYDNALQSIPHWPTSNKLLPHSAIAPSLSAM